VTFGLRIVLALGATLGLAMWQSDGCGYTPDPLKGPGEPCTRTSECEASLVCSGGVCMRERPDAGPGFDAGVLVDAGSDASADGGDSDASADGGDLDASADGGDPDSGAAEAGVAEAGADAAVDGG